MNISSSITKRRGIIKVSHPLITDGDIGILKALYSNFYPLSIEPENDFGEVRNFVMKGMSEHFDEVEEGSVIPQYEMEFFRNKDGVITFSKCIKHT